MEPILEALKKAAVDLREATEKQRLAGIEYRQAKDRFDSAIKDCGITLA